MDFPIKNGDFPWQNVSSPEGTYIHSPVLAVLGTNNASLVPEDPIVGHFTHPLNQLGKPSGSLR